MPRNSTQNRACFKQEAATSARAVLAQHAATAADAYLSARPRPSLSAGLEQALSIVPVRHKRIFRAAFLDALGQRLAVLEECQRGADKVEVDGYLFQEMVSIIAKVSWLAAYGGLTARGETGSEYLDELVQLRLGIAALGMIRL